MPVGGGGGLGRAAYSASLLRCRSFIISNSSGVSEWGRQPGGGEGGGKSGRDCSAGKRARPPSRLSRRRGLIRESVARCQRLAGRRLEMPYSGRYRDPSGV